MSPAPAPRPRPGTPHNREGMRQDAYTAYRARMLPMDGPITAEVMDQVRRDFVAYLKEVSSNQTQAARQLGYSPSVVSQWVAGDYPGKNEEICRAVNDWMERDARARRHRQSVEYVPTALAEQMRSIIQIAQARCHMAAIVAPSGCGKTVVLELMAEKTRGFYLYCHEDLTPRAFLEAVADLVKLGKVGRRAWGAAALMQAIVERLSGSSRPLFLDEAHRLRRDVFSRIRSIHDQARVAVVMAGTQEVVEAVDDSASARGQLTSRCMKYDVREALDGGSGGSGGGSGGSGGSGVDQEERPMLFSREEVRAFLSRFAVRVDPGAFELLWRVACLPGSGSLRTVRSCVELIQATPRFAGKSASRSVVASVLGMLFGASGRVMVRAAAEERAEPRSREAAG